MSTRACEKCDTVQGDTPTETVDGRGPGWKCSCGWWNWIHVERHRATAAAWEWIETGPGVFESVLVRANIVVLLTEMDDALHELDRHVAAKFLNDPLPVAARNTT